MKRLAFAMVCVLCVGSFLDLAQRNRHSADGRLEYSHGIEGQERKSP